MNLFTLGKFQSHSGQALNWKIECDALTGQDWECLAYMIAERLNFGEVRGLPRGGLMLAASLQKYVVEGHYRRLLVDDVWTTGASFAKELRPGEVGFVIFARTPVKPPVQALFALSTFTDKALP